MRAPSEPYVCLQSLGIVAMTLLLSVLTVSGSADEDSRRKRRPKKTVESAEGSDSETQDTRLSRAKKPPETEAEVGDVGSATRKRGLGASLAAAARALVKRKPRQPEAVSETSTNSTAETTSRLPRRRKGPVDWSQVDPGIVTLRDINRKRRRQVEAEPPTAIVGSQPRILGMRKSYNEWGNGYLGGFPSPSNTEDVSMDVEDQDTRASGRRVSSWIPPAAASQYGSIPGGSGGDYISPTAALKVAGSSVYDTVSASGMGSQYMSVGTPLRTANSSGYDSVSAAGIASQYIPVPEGRGSRRVP